VNKESFPVHSALALGPTGINLIHEAFPMQNSLSSSADHKPAMLRPATATVITVSTDEALLASVRKALAHAGVACLTAERIQDAIKPSRRGGANLLLIDFPLSGSSGQEELERHHKTGKSIPFVALIAPGAERLGLELMRGGALDCLLKDAQLLERLPPVIKEALERLEEQSRLAASQEALRQSEARHRALFEWASVGMMEGCPQTGRFLRVNEAFCQITGYSAQELQTKSFSELTYPEDRETDWQAYQRAVRGETRDYRSEKRYLRKDGSPVWVRVNVFVIRDAHGRPVHTVGLAEEITERKRSEAELQLYRDLFFYAPAGLCIGNADSRTIGRVNPAFARMHGYERPEALEGRLIEDIYAPEEWPNVAGIIRRAHQGHCQVESVHVRSDGSRFPVLIDVIGVSDEVGRLLYRVVSTVDLSERKRAETELQALKDQLAADLAAMNRLHDLSTRLLKAADLDELLDEILEATVSLQGADFGSVQFYNRRSGTLELVAHRGFHQADVLEPFRAIREGSAACGLALERRQRVIVEDTEADPAFAAYRALAAAAGFRAVQSTPMFGRDGEPLGVLSTLFRHPHRPSAQDLRLTDLYVGQVACLIERKQAEEALRASEARYRALVHATSVAVWRLTPDGERQLSLEGGNIQGHGEPETHPGDWLSQIHPEDRARTHEAWRQAVAAQSLYEIEHRVVIANGSYQYMLSRGAPIRNAAGDVVEWIGTSADITARKQAETALRESEERYRHVSESGFITISFFTADGRITDANDAFLRLMGYSRQELAAGLVRWERLTPPEWLQRTRQAMAEFEATGHMIPYEKEYLRRDGSRFWGLVGAARLEGRPEGVAFVLDITERKEAEEALREREAQLAFAQRIGRVGVWGCDLGSWTSFVTPESCAIVGIPDPASIRSLPDFLALVHPDDRARIQAASWQVIKTGCDMDFQLRVLHPERGDRWMLARAQRQPAADGRGHRLLGVIIDITEQKRTEKALRASEERLRFAAQAAGFGIYELDLVTGQAYRSPEYQSLFGLHPEQEFHLDADCVPIYVHPDDHAVVREATRESRDPRGSGIKDVEYRVLLPDGTVRWLLVRGRTFFEGAGKARRPVRSRGIALDITERKQLEQEILEISGREQRRIGHDLHDDLCQRLGGVQLLSGVLEQELAAEGHPRAPQANRILALVQEALDRARMLARGLAPVAVEAGGLTTALEELAGNAAELFQIRCEFRGELLVGITDAGAATHLYRIAQEAISNAARHGRAKRVVIRLRDGGDCFELSVVDEGRGFARTTAAMAGMGLRIMKYRAAMLGATLEVRSAPGQGTTVTCAFGKGLCSVTP